MAEYIKDDRWLVQVWALPPHDETREYVVDAETEKDAAFAGIDRFCEEMEAKS
jgi:hypothetical protein